MTFFTIYFYYLLRPETNTNLASLTIQWFKLATRIELKITRLCLKMKNHFYAFVVLAEVLIQKKYLH